MDLKKIPYVIGEFFSVNDVYRLITGKDPLTGEDASRSEAAGWLRTRCFNCKN